MKGDFVHDVGWLAGKEKYSYSFTNLFLTINIQPFKNKQIKKA
jgi:hypothetical protein